MTAQRIPEPAGLEGERVGVEQAPAAGRGRGDRRQARSEDRAHRTGERERDRAVGSELHAGGGLDERLRHGRAGNQLSRVGSGIRSQARGAAATEMLPARSCADADEADVHRPARMREAQRPLVTVHTQHDLPHRRAEPRRRRGRPGRARASGHASRALGVRTTSLADAVRPTSQPAHPGRRTVSSTVSFSPTRSCVSGHSLPCRTATGTLRPSGRRTTTLETRPA